jgi:hypothetical protein
MMLQSSIAALASSAATPGDAGLQAAAKKAQEAAQQSALELHYSVAELLDSLDCADCGWDKCMPRCPVEWDATKHATVKKYVQVLQSNGVSVQSELHTVETTRLGLMEHGGLLPNALLSSPASYYPHPNSCEAAFLFLAVQGAFDIADPHLFIEEWTSHVRNLSYATVGDDTILIQTDFSAQYPHKAAWTNTCEHPPTSNMDVFVVTRVLIDAEGKRKELAPPPSPHHPAPSVEPQLFCRYVHHRRVAHLQCRKGIVRFSQQVSMADHTVLSWGHRAQGGCCVHRRLPWAIQRSS